MEHTHDFRPVWFRMVPSAGNGTVMVLGAAPTFDAGPTFYICQCGEQGFNVA